MVTLLIYMLIAPIVTHGIDVKLPKSSPLNLSYEDPVTISVSRKGSIYINNSLVAKEKLGEHLAAVIAAKSDQPVVIRADDDLHYREIVSIMDIAKRSGVINLGLATRVER